MRVSNPHFFAFNKHCRADKSCPLHTNVCIYIEYVSPASRTLQNNSYHSVRQKLQTWHVPLSIHTTYNIARHISCGAILIEPFNRMQSPAAHWCMGMAENRARIRSGSEACYKIILHKVCICDVRAAYAQVDIICMLFHWLSARVVQNVLPNDAYYVRYCYKGLHICGDAAARAHI